MKRFFIVLIFVYTFFLAEFFLFNMFGRWGKPDLLLLLIIFFNLYLGVRYGLLCAFCAGLLRDSFGPDPFGTYMFLFMVSACLATILRRNFYQPGSRLSRLAVTFGVVTIFIFTEAFFKSMANDINLLAVLRHIFIPEMVTTMMVATFVFIKLKEAAQRVHL
jgi:rod shape-determining protein MreD